MQIIRAPILDVGPISKRQIKLLVNLLALADRREIIKSTSGSDIVSELLDKRGKLVHILRTCYKNLI
jgi:hypothetical protein